MARRVGVLEMLLARLSRYLLCSLASFRGSAVVRRASPRRHQLTLQCSQAASLGRLWVALCRPGLLQEAAGPDCGPQSGFRGLSDRAWPDCRYLQAFE